MPPIWATPPRVGGHHAQGAEHRHQLIDTADAYGDSEEVVGQALQGRPGNVVLAAQFGDPMAENPTARHLPALDESVLGGKGVAVLRHLARMSVDDGPGFTCWHTDCYRHRDETWHVTCSQATATAPKV